MSTKSKYYKCGKVIIRNTDLLRDKLKAKKGEFLYVGIQRSLAFYNRSVYVTSKSKVSTISKLLNGVRKDIVEDEYKLCTYEDCEFCMDLITKWDNVVGKAKIKGKGIFKIDSNGNKESVFDIIDVKILGK